MGGKKDLKIQVVEYIFVFVGHFLWPIIQVLDVQFRSFKLNNLMYQFTN
jgi:hypothetical protein